MIRNFKRLMKKRNEKEYQRPSLPSQQHPLFQDLNDNIQVFQSIYSKCADVVFRTFVISEDSKMALIYIDGLTNTSGIEEMVIAPLMRLGESETVTVKQIEERKIFVAQTRSVETFEQCMDAISTGFPILLCHNESAGLSLGLNKWEHRGIEDPTSEVMIRGSREGFTETMITNLSQIRRIIKSPQLKIEMLKIGEYTNTKVAIAYIENLTDETLIQEVTNRLSRIQIDGILESGYIEELIEDNPYSPFPQLLSTERPDVTCAGLLEGRVAILTEGTPFVLIAPTTLPSLLQSAEDYYQRFWSGTVIRWLRYTFFLVSLFLPSLYVAVLTYHQEMIPGNLIYSMASSRESVPFPAFVEALLMEVTFEALREAGIRLPKQVGAAVSIVGALVIGQGAVQAGLVSAPMVIVVAITGIASFIIPRYVLGIAIRLMRFPMILLGGTLGLLGVMLGFLAILIHLSSLRSFGAPYLSAISATNANELKDVFIRAPWWKMDIRPHFTGEYNKFRSASDQKPGPEHDDSRNP
ncbi:spore germination protein [Paenibacillus aceris]|uniref:Spore germination protein KA n=1 Tax=Paenibacillus aceris TaxID=869555 RepID=A0ABS4HWS4_9BACL|nr:spore germination protein [Paenibacillus aceris]MBP1963072.1 spore germination protein KA [Paenibacillus aceris]NHW38807.1 spore germination protein [Paenibacillus aceris]